MSKMADLEIEIMDMLEEGESPSYISRVLNVPVSWVYEAFNSSEEFEEEIFNPFLTINS